MLKKRTGEYAINADGANADDDIQLKSRDQELIFDSGGDRDETTEETKNIDDMTIDIGNGRGDASVLQNDETVMRT